MAESLSARWKNRLSKAARRKYRYSALSTERREFRVLILSPSRPGKSLSGTLKVVSMLSEPKPEYKTMSYAWGDNTLTNYILLDGRHLDIPASAHEALEGVLRKGYHGAIWIDAICINQADEQERGQQVCMMGGEMGIYLHTSLNLIWLGRSDDATAKVVEAVDLVLRDMRQDVGHDLKHLYAMVHDPDTGSVIYSKKPFSIDFEVDHLLKLFSRPWFSRLWVVQEAALAPHSIIICGDFELQLLDVVRAARWCEFKIDYLRFDSSSLDPSTLLSRLREIFDLVDRMNGLYEGTKYITILDCLFMGRYFDTTLEVDKAYATLGLIAPFARKSRFLQPDYSRPLVDVLRDATYEAGNQVDSPVDVLRQVSHHTEDEVVGKAFPSWVPQWHIAFDRDFDSIDFASFFNASNGLQPANPQHWTLNGNVLTVEGFRVDTVKEITSRYKGLKSTTSDLSFVRECQRLASSDDLAGTNDLPSENLARTLIAATNSQRQLAEPEEIRAFDPWFAGIELERPALALRELHGEESEDTVLASHFDQAMQEYCVNRRFFVTSAGRIGVGPQLMLPGDSVVVLASGRVPFVLREDHDIFHLVGQCYVDGIMFGEAVQEHHKSGGENTLFRLR